MLSHDKLSLLRDFLLGGFFWDIFPTEDEEDATEAEGKSWEVKTLQWGCNCLGDADESHLKKD